MLAEITQDKVQMLLSARSAVDSHRERKVAAESLLSGNVLSKGKIQELTMDSKIQIVDLRSQYSSAVVESFGQCESELSAIGMDLAKLKLFNTDMCIEYAKLLFPMVQECDRCTGMPDPPAPPCTRSCRNSYYHTWEHTGIKISLFYSLFVKITSRLTEFTPEVMSDSGSLAFVTKRPVGYEFKVNGLGVSCPPGHGFILKYAGVPEGIDYINIFWHL